MKKIKHITIILSFLIILMFVSGCSDFLDELIENPSTVTSSGSETSVPSSSDQSTLNETGFKFAEGSGERLSLSIPQIVALTHESVVEISTETVVSGGRISQYVSEGAGSGVIISRDGYIVTNNHVIEGAGKITVMLTKGETYAAELIGRDAQTDLAVLKISADNLIAAVFGNSDKLVVGELAVAIGNPLGQLGGTVTEGIISALNRSITIDGEEMSLMQTTAAINPGNSGGGLFNSYSELIGVVNAKSSGSDIEGLGFAIPSNTVMEIVALIIDNGYVPGRIDLGIELIDITSEFAARVFRVRELGVYVAQVNSSEYFKAGDRITSIDGKEVGNAAQIKSILKGYNVGETVPFIVMRNGQITPLSVILQEFRD